MEGLLSLARDSSAQPPPLSPLHPAPSCHLPPRFPLPEEDFDISIRSFEWPKKMLEVMKEATTKANGEHKEFEQQLKRRRKVGHAG